MIDKYLNIDKVISIKIFDKRPVFVDDYGCRLIHVKGTIKHRRLKFNGIKIGIKYDYYEDDIFDYIFSGKITRTNLNKLYLMKFRSENIENNYIIENNILFEKPRIEITLVNDERINIHRDSITELYDYLESIGLSDNEHIIKV